MRLNTPGGSVAPSQEIYEKVKEIALQNKKPIILSTGMNSINSIRKSVGLN